MRMRRIRRRVTEGATDWGVGAGIIRLVAGTHYPTLFPRAIICHFFFCNIIGYIIRNIIRNVIQNRIREIIIRLVAGTHYPTLFPRAIICHFFFCKKICSRFLVRRNYLKHTSLCAFLSCTFFMRMLMLVADDGHDC